MQFDELLRYIYKKMVDICVEAIYTQDKEEWFVYNT